MRRLLPIFFSLALTAPAFAQTDDGPGVEALVQDLSRYLGQEAFAKGFVRVTAEGDAYRITLNFDALADLLPQQDVATFDLDPYAFLVKPRGDGTWDVSADGTLNGSFEVSGPQGRQSTQWTSTDLEWHGVYDPLLAAFTDASGALASMTMTSQDAKQEVEASTGPSTFEMTATGTARDGVDFTFAQQIADFTETIKFSEPDMGQGFFVKLVAPTVSADGSGKGFRSRSLLDVLAFAVANSNKAKLAANQAELKSLLLAALPLWERMNGRYQVHGLVVESPVGNFSAAEFATEVAMDGIQRNGTIEYTMALSDLKIPAHLLPAWSAPLLPTHVSLNFGGVDLNFEDMVTTAIKALDLSQDPPIPPHVGERIAADLMANPPRIVISPSSMRNRDTEIAFEGEMTFPGPRPEANVTVEVAGYDGIVDALKDASQSDPEAAQYAAMALAMKGFGQTQPDGRIRWTIDQNADGSVVVNGVTLKPAD